MRNLKMKLVVLLVLLTLPVLLLAQEVASVTGSVTDATGAVIPGVQVTLLNTQTNATHQAITSPTGFYTISKVLPGPGYRLSFTLKGFETLVVNDIYLGVGAVRTQNANLKIGSLTEQVEVSAGTEDISLNTTDATVGTNFSMNNVINLPIAIRDSPAALLSLQPGVSNATGGTTTSRAGAVTGARGDQNNVTLDGLDVNDFATGQAFATVANAPVDSIQEFRGETVGSLAASGRGSGGQVQMVTKSGTNTFHGSAYEYHRNTITSANEYFNKLSGIDRPALIRNQFGGTFGGPAIKNKLFFFFNYNGRRDAFATTGSQTVPLDSFRNGIIQYYKADGSIGQYNAGQVAALDPQHVGFNTALQTFVNGRYPHANDVNNGDGLNTGLYRFNIPVHRNADTYVSRIDYNLSNTMKLFGRFNIQRDTYGDYVNGLPVQFAGDPLTKAIQNKSYAYVIGHTWTISPTMVNQFAYGETVSRLAFPTLFNPAGDNSWTFGSFSGPYASSSSQARRNPIPVFKDDLSWQKGAHNIQLGGTFKPIKTWNQLVNDRNYVTLGLGGHTSELDDTLRPTDIATDATSSGYWDSAFAFALGRYASISTTYNYNNALKPLALQTGENREYRYYESEAYIQDTWKVNNNLTLNYGLRYQYYSVPFEVNGAEAVGNMSFNDYLLGRAANGAAGISGYGAVPIVYYNLAGKANGQRGLYEPNLTNFSPRFSFAYTPNFLERIFGERKTVLRGGAGLIYDHPVVNALNFIQDQNSYMFQSSSNLNYGGTDATDALLNNPRFAGISTIPSQPSAPMIAKPYAPYYDSTTGETTGTIDNQFNYGIDPGLKTPYAITFNVGFQRELPGHFVLESTYVGRLGRRLIAQADASQLVDFKDPISGQLMSAAFADLEKQLRSGKTYRTVTGIPWFDNMVTPSPAVGTGTKTVAGYLSSLTKRGDVADIVQALQSYYYIYGFGLSPNVGMPAQFAGNTFITNKGSSSYNGLLTSLHKNMSNGLQFDINYTFSHSIDNVSQTSNYIASNAGLGYVCDALNLRTCRGNSDFDMTHIVNGDFIYELPFGKGKLLGKSAGPILDRVIGGWQISGVPTWRSGIAFTTISDAYLMGYANNAPAILTGDPNALLTNIHQEGGKVWLFATPAAARSAYSFPTGFDMGSRNSLRGPQYFNVDLALAKRIPVNERVNFNFRAEAYNAFNHPSFGLPGGGTSNSGANINSVNFGRITNTSSSARVAQFSLRLEF
jgi:hypothetical protein